MRHHLHSASKKSINGTVSSATRYVDAQAKPPRWEDMARATTFARERWATLSNSAALSKLKVRFDNGLSAMEADVRNRNIVQARAAAKAELEMVDELERAFARSK